MRSENGYEEAINQDFLEVIWTLAPSAGSRTAPYSPARIQCEWRPPVAKV